MPILSQTVFPDPSFSPPPSAQLAGDTADTSDTVAQSVATCEP